MTTVTSAPSAHPVRQALDLYQRLMVFRVYGTLQISDVMSISAPDTFTRPVYAGNAISTVRSKDDIKLFTVRASTWEPAQEGDKEAPVDVKEAENVGPGKSPSRH